MTPQQRLLVEAKLRKARGLIKEYNDNLAEVKATAPEVETQTEEEAENG